MEAYGIRLKQRDADGSRGKHMEASQLLSFRIAIYIIIKYFDFYGTDEALMGESTFPKELKSLLHFF